MTSDVTAVFATYLGRNRGPIVGDSDAQQAPNYGVSARLIGPIIKLTLTFRTGAAYCCYEPDCHLSLLRQKHWTVLRRDLADAGLTVPITLELRLTMVIEAGALFYDFARPVLSRPGVRRYGFVPARAYQCEYIIHEREAAEA